MDLELDRQPTPPFSLDGPTSGPPTDRGVLRRTFGLSLLHAFRSLGDLMARSGRASGYDVTALRDAIRNVEALLTSLRAMHAAEAREEASP